MRALPAPPTRSAASPPLGRAVVTPFLAIGLLALPPGHASAQSDVTFELGASQIGPPIGVEGSDARYALVGLRASTYGAGGSGAFGSVLLGQTLDQSAGGSFLSGIVEGSLVDRWSPSWSGRLEARALGYGAQSPWPYRAYAVEGGPAVRLRTTHFGLEVEGVAGAGQSRLEVERPLLDVTRVFETELWRYGGTAEITLGPLDRYLALAGGLHRTPAGNYANVGGRISMAGRWGVTELRIDWWDTPTSTEVAGGLAFVLALGDVWSLRGFFGRTDPDPLTLAQPGSGSGGALLGASLAPGGSVPTRAPSLFEVLDAGAERSSVRVRVDAPTSARTVAVLGDFTLWEPVAMRRDGDAWAVELDVPVGIHHFGFLIDNDEWYVPDDAPDVAPDEWGRLTATLVIEGATP